MSTAVPGSPAAREGNPTEWDTEVAAASIDPVYFIDSYGVIDAARESGDEGSDRATATVPFRLWPEQADLMWDLATEKLVVILKARQLGISWCVCAYVLWHCLFAPGRRAMLFSKGQMEANELLRRVRVLYERLPEWFRERVPKLTEQNTRALVWSNASRVQSMPATTSAGVSYTATLVVLDEAAKGQMRLNGSKLYASVKPTIDAAGQMVVLSTAEGMGGFFHNLWTRAVQGLNGFRAVFLPWDVHPGRGPGFRERMLAEADDPKTVPQEYPENPIEAFVGTGRLRFDPEWIIPQALNTRDPIPVERWGDSLKTRKGWPGLDRFALPHLWEFPRRALRVYQAPVPGVKYVLAADVAEGKDPKGKNDPDYDAAVLFREDTWEEVASLHGRWEPDAWAIFLMALSEPYNQCPVVVERNNHGHATLNTLKAHHFPVERVGLGHDGYPGWLTTQVTKPEGVNLLAAALRDALVTVRSMAALLELQHYTVLKNGTTGALAGFHDDFVSAWVVGLSWLRYQSTRNVGGPSLVGGQAPARRSYAP